MNERGDEIDAKLQELARATEGVGPSAQFGERVRQALTLERSTGWVFQLIPPTRRLLAFAAVAAVLAVGWAVRNNDALDEALAAASEPVELSW